MIDFIVFYIIGIVLCFVILLCCTWWEQDITVGETLMILMWSLASWCTILIILLLIIVRLAMRLTKKYEKFLQAIWNKVIINKHK